MKSGDVIRCEDHPGKRYIVKHIHPSSDVVDAVIVNGNGGLYSFPKEICHVDMKATAERNEKRQKPSKVTRLAEAG